MTATDETIVRHRTSSRRTRRRLVAKPPGEPRPGRTRERLQDLRILLDVARRISGHDSLGEIFEALAEMTSLAISCDRSSFFLNDSSTGELYSRVAQGVHRREIRLLNNEGIAGAAFQTAERVQKARAQEQAFLDIVADIISQLDLDQLLQRVMTEVTRILGAERSTLFLHDEKTRELFSRVAMGAKLGEIRFPDHAGI